MTINSAAIWQLDPGHLVKVGFPGTQSVSTTGEEPIQNKKSHIGYIITLVIAVLLLCFFLMKVMY